MNNKEKEKWLYEVYKYTRDFDFRKLDKYEEANDALCISDLILDYTMLYEFYKEKTRKLKKEKKELKSQINLLEDIRNYLNDTIDKAIETLKLCNSKCSEEVISILRGDK